MTQRRAMGELEQEVLAKLWVLDRPATPADVLDALDSDLAYTTIETVLSRLWQKGLASRERSGRAYAYTPSMSEAELAAARMSASLAAASDRKGALSQFVGSLSAREAKTLRALLDDMTRSRPKR